MDLIRKILVVAELRLHVTCDLSIVRSLMQRGIASMQDYLDVSEGRFQAAHNGGQRYNSTSITSLIFCSRFTICGELFKC